MVNPLKIIFGRRNTGTDKADALRVRELNLQERKLATAQAYIEAIRYPKDRPIHTADRDDNERWSMPPWERYRSIGEARHLAQNDLSVIGFLEAFRVHGIGAEGGKVVFCTHNEEWNKAANTLMRAANRDCDYRIPGLSITEYLGIAVESLIRDGDFAIVVDNDLTECKIQSFEADQIAQVNQDEWDAHAVELGWCYEDTLSNGAKLMRPYHQHSGCMTDQYGRLRAIAVTCKRGQSSVCLSDATIYSSEICRIVLKSTRFGQYRGNSMLLPMLQIISDFRDLIASEVKSAKAIAKDAVIVKTDNPAAAMLASVGLTADQLSDGTNDIIKPTNPQRFENLENQYGGGVQYASTTDVIEHVKNDRPAPQIAVFEMHAKKAAGLSLGLYKMFATGEVSTSYSAARCELWLTIAAFRCMGALLKSRVLDFRNECLVNEWVATGKLPPIPEGMHPVDTYTIEWAPIVEINPGDEVKAAAARIAAGLSNWDIENGAANNDVITALGRNVKLLRDNGLDFMEFFAGEKAKAPKAAAPVVEKSDDDDDDKKEENEDE